jgi:hypothetical protein
MKQISSSSPFPPLSACAVRGTGLPRPRPRSPNEPVVEADACGAARFAYLVGQPKSLADRTAFPPKARGHPPGTAVTHGSPADRLNVLIDGNAEVERVYCG